MMGGGMMGGFGGGVSGLGLFGGLFSLVFSIGLLAALVLLGIWLWRKVSPALSPGTTVQPLTRTRSVGNQSAREILQTRYARGELTREEYLAMLQDLARE
jgi:putative membrane protein